MYFFNSNFHSNLFLNLVRKKCISFFRESLRNMLKQNTCSKTVVVYEHLKFPFEGVHSYRGCRKLEVISDQSTPRLRQVSGVKK